jgi:hypothetical protein
MKEGGYHIGTNALGENSETTMETPKDSGCDENIKMALVRGSLPHQLDCESVRPYEEVQIL